MGCNCRGNTRKSTVQAVGEAVAPASSPPASYDGPVYRVTFPDGGHQDYPTQGEAARESRRTGGTHATILTSAVY